MSNVGIIAAKALGRLRSGGLRALWRSVSSSARTRYEQWLDASLDRKYGIDTLGVHADLAALGAGGEHLHEATGYEAIQIPMFRAMMRAAAIDPAGYMFVDFGCGKGRALVLAAEYGFKRVVGVELAPALYETACRNVGAFRRRRPRAAPIDLHCGDAAQFRIPAGDVVLYFYHPFGEGVMRKVAATIERACASRTRNFVVAYRNPVHYRVFEDLGWLRLVARNKSFAMYA